MTDYEIWVQLVYSILIEDINLILHLSKNIFIIYKNKLRLIGVNIKIRAH